MTYQGTEKRRAVAWKQLTRTLPEDARRAAPYVGTDGARSEQAYDFCLPPEHASLNLLPEVREEALDLFQELGIPWHASVEGGPSNHLVDSQVQCVNALGQMVRDPGRIERAFGDLLGIREVLPVEPGRYLTFEYVGPEDYFGEAPGEERIRGSKCTSVDAAFLHRDMEGTLELVLLEWKYTEKYRLRRPDPARDETRRRRYEASVEDPTGPIRSHVLPFELLLDEPIYQLVRQQLLAHALEVDGAEGAERVRVLHVLSPANEEYQRSVHRDEHRRVGGSVGAIWGSLLARPDRFTPLDPAVFLDPAITSEEYVRRYG